MRTNMLSSIVILGLALASRPASAQEPVAIAPLIDDDTALVIHIHLARANIDNLLRHAESLGLLDEADRKHWLQLHAAFMKAGGRDIYFRAQLSDLGQHWDLRYLPTLIVLLAEGADADKLSKLIEETFAPEPVVKLGQFVVAEWMRPAAELKKFKATARPELAQALASVSESDFRLVFAPPPELRRAVDEMVPKLPVEMGGGSSKPLAQGLRWLAAGFDSHKPTELRAVLQASDTDAAGQLKRIVRDSIDVGLDRFIKNLAGEYAAKPIDPKELATALSGIEVNTRGARVLVKMPLDRSVEAIGRLTHEALRQRHERIEGKNRLIQIALAIHSFHDAYKRFPGNIVDRTGKPLLSWRVAILPFIEQGPLFNEFHLDEPWDSGHNKKLIAQMPQMYRRATSKAPAGKTTYQMAVGKDTMLCPNEQGIMFVPDAKLGPTFVSRDPKHPGYTFKDVTDGTSNTILVADVTDGLAVAWTRPDDWTPDAADPRKGAVGSLPGGFLAALVDGSVLFLRADVKIASVRAYLTRNGNEVIEDR